VRMRWRLALALVLPAALITTLWAQRAFRQYPSVEYGLSVPIPRDWNVPAEFVWARLMYAGGPLDGYQRTGRFTGPWQEGLSLWTQDYPRADRSLARTLRRLTRIDVRSVEQSVNPDDGDEIYNWPFLYAVEVGEWQLTQAQANKLRDYLLRGGFFMADGCHGTEEWAYFAKTMKMVFPERQLVDLPNEDPIFHTVFNLDDRMQIVGAEHLREGHKKDGYVARWMGIYDDKERLMVAADLNSDMGDSWEFEDDPRYPLDYSIMGAKIATNYVTYAMTH
jgi:hypothetical protein